MSGKSATGNGGKVGYYEHVWATKRDCALTKKTFKCDPHRIPAKVIEPLVWTEFTKFVSDPKFVREIFKRAEKLKAASPRAKDSDRIKAKLAGHTSQLAALTERLSELPSGVPATPIYNQMAKLEGLRVELAAALEKSNADRSNQELAKWETFDQFSAIHRKLLKDGLDADQKRTLIQKFVRKIEVGPKSVKVHFIVDEGHYGDELAQAKARKPAPKGAKSELSTFAGSNTLTVGTRDRT